MSVPKPDGDKKHMVKDSVVAGASLDRKSHPGHPAELAGAGLSSWRLNSERKNSQRAKNVLLTSIMQAKIVEVEQCQRDYAQLSQTRNGFARGGKTPDAIKKIAAQSELDQCHKKLNALFGDLELIEQTTQEDSTAQDDQARAACLRHLKQLTLLKQNKFVQSALPWDVGAGQCAAFCYEYIHRRRAGAAPELILTLMGNNGVQGRMAAAQAENLANNRKTRALEQALLHHPRIDRLFVATLKRDLPRAIAYHLHGGYAYIERILRAEHGYPDKVKSTSLKMENEIIGIDFSLEALTMMWPAGRQMLPELKSYATAGKAALVQPGATSTSTSTSSLSLSRLPRLPQGLSAQSAMHNVTHGARPVVEQDLQRYLHALQNLQHNMLTNTEHPFFLLVIHCGARGQAHLVDANETHAIVLDASKEHCGIFDPNFGFLPMYFARRHLELPWLLALLFMEYDASRFSLCILE